MITFYISFRTLSLSSIPIKKSEIRLLIEDEKSDHEDDPKSK